MLSRRSVRSTARALAAVCLMAAATSAGAQTPTHAYTLNGTFADLFGGPSLVSLGGTLGPTGYTAPTNQGLSLSNAINPTNYSIEMTYNFAAGADLSSWRKILDFKNRTADAGVYGFNANLQFFPVVTAPVTAIQAGVPAHLLLTRNGGTNEVNAFINGALQFTFNDAGGLATFTGPGNIIHFLTDDFAVTGESAPGFIDWIRIYDQPITVAQAAVRFQLGDNPLITPPTTSVPEPSTVVLLAAGLLGVGVITRRRRNATH